MSWNGTERFFIWHGWFQLTGLHTAAKAYASVSSKPNGIIPTSAPAKLQPAFIWFKERWADRVGGGACLPLSHQLPVRHTKHWPSERSHCLSPLGPYKELSININGHCTKWAHWLFTRVVEVGVEDYGRLLLLWGNEKNGKVNLKKSGPLLLAYGSS